MKNKIQTREIYRYLFAVIILVTGILLNYLNIGKEFLGFSSVGNWLIYISFVMIAIITLQLFVNKKRIVDERMMYIATKASRITFLALIITAFIIMIIDGINPIKIPYSLSMSYLICFLMIIYFISYKILLRKY